MAFTTSTSLLCVGYNKPLTLLDGLDDWWDWDGGSFTSAKGVSQNSTGSGSWASSIPTSGGKPNGYSTLSTTFNTSAKGHVELHNFTGATYDQQVNNLPYTVTLCTWIFAGGRSCIRIGGSNIEDYYSTSVVGAISGVHIGNMQAFSKYGSNALQTVTIPNTYLKGSGFTFVVFEYSMNNPSDILNIYSDISGSLSLINSVTITSLATNPSGKVFLDGSSAASASSSISTDGLCSYNRKLTLVEMNKIYNNGNGVTYSQLLTL